jgi:transcriptional regulator with XRE-family HTH domain
LNEQVKNMVYGRGFLKVDFLTNLDLLLKSNGMKRADLARAIDVAPSTINSWYARGSEKVNIKVLKAIASYY